MAARATRDKSVPDDPGHPPSTATASFPALPVSVPEARRFLRAFLVEHQLEEAFDGSAELALSEVVTNAVLHAHTTFDVVLRLQEPGRLRVEVSDANPQPPVQRGYAEQATTGRGMDIVMACTADCGVESRQDGKTVWFVLDAAAQPSAEDWEFDLDAAWAQDEDVAVALLALPPTLWLAAAEHHDAVLRELALYTAEHPEQAPSPDRIALADRARTWVSAGLLAELLRLAGDEQAAHRALPTGHPSPLPDTPDSVDLRLSLPTDAADAFSALQDVLDAAERLAAEGLLLARPGLPEIVALRDWACEQAISQLSEVIASPWPGIGQERFTSVVHDRHHPRPLDWDDRLVTESQRGAVAADDANRIIAISRPLAAALGWAVEDVVGRRVVALIPTELREAHVAGFTRHLTTGESHVLGVPLVLPVLRSDGTRVDCTFLIEQVPAPAGRAVYVAWIEPAVEV